MKNNKIENIIIIGSGPAGYTAGIYAARSSLKPLLLTGLEPGGQLMITTEVENYPGYENPIQGPWLMDQMKKQALAMGVKVENDIVKKVNFQKFPFEIFTESREIKTYSVVISTGAKAKWLNIDGEKEFRGFGISACATCDGFFFKDREVAVIGGGNTAVEEALYLSNICEKVFLIHRRDKLRAEMILQERLFKKKNIHLLWNKIVKKFVGDTKPRTLRQVDIFDKKSNQSSSLKVDGVFVAIGHSPSTEVFSGCVPMDKEGYIYTVDNLTQTKIDGVFAAGDVSDKKYRQAITAAGFGCMSAIEAESFLSKKNII
ncbi:MAG: thioredoxin-disulfide reductase [Rickettsiales bacterium]|nr:thioredoxin-disulfide reductase [Rickettsiales bacterium]